MVDVPPNLSQLGLDVGTSDSIGARRASVRSTTVGTDIAPA
jgi:hypothetical protein